MPLSTRSGIKGNRDLDIPREVQSAGDPEAAKAVDPLMSTRLTETGFRHVILWLTADFSLKSEQNKKYHISGRIIFCAIEIVHIIFLLIARCNRVKIPQADHIKPALLAFCPGRAQAFLNFHTQSER